jgi:hypothetical protein
VQWTSAFERAEASSTEKPEGRGFSPAVRHGLSSGVLTPEARICFFSAASLAAERISSSHIDSSAPPWEPRIYAGERGFSPRERSRQIKRATLQFAENGKWKSSRAQRGICFSVFSRRGNEFRVLPHSRKPRVSLSVGFFGAVTDWQRRLRAMRQSASCIPGPSPEFLSRRA